MTHRNRSITESGRERIRNDEAAMPETTSEIRYSAETLTAYAAALFAAAGCDGDKPAIIASSLVEADLLGHTTHGLQLAPTYLDELATGGMTPTGEPDVVADRGAVVTWDGRKLPGVWLATQAVELAAERAEKFGTGTVVIRRSHHIGCLAAFLQRATDRGLMVIVASSDPASSIVAPFGGREAVYTPNPLAVGIPTSGEPILIDISASITTNGMSNRLRREGKRFPGLWALDAAGRPTDNPEELFTSPPGTLLPVGGRDHGHKGYGLALTIEALTQGLGGFGRSFAPVGLGGAVFVQALDPEAFGSRADFLREMDWLANTCRTCPPAEGCEVVRLPGQRGLASKREALREGVLLYPGILEALAPFGERFGVKL
jgi:LDH2 family malate/lactate/ureidoglycolate dehydrogenase